MASLKLMLNRDRMLNNGKYPLVFQIIHNRKRKLLYTPYKLFEEQFDSVFQKVVYIEYSGSFSEKEVAKLNKDLVQERRRLEKIIVTLERNVDNYTVDEVLGLVNKQNLTYKFLSYMDARITSKRNQNKSGIAEAYKSTRSSLSKFVGRSDININEINPRFVREYEEFLRCSCLTENTIAFYMRNFRTIYNSIIRDGYNPKCSNPFQTIKTSPAKTIKRALDKTIMKKLVEMQFDKIDYRLDLARDVFLFSFYTRGMSFVDIVYLKRSDIIDSTIVYQRQKTNQRLTIGVTPQLQMIIDKYISCSEFLMPILNSSLSQPLYQQYRSALAKNIRNLKQLGELLNLPMKLTTYVARHTWATMAKQNGVPLMAISESLGHTSEQTTKIYLKELDKNILDKINETIIRL